MPRSNDLRAQRAQLVADARKLIGGDKVSDEDNAKFDAMMGEVDRFDAQITRTEKAERLEAETAFHRQEVRAETGVSVDEQTAKAGREGRVLAAWATGRVSNLNDADLAVFRQRTAPDGRFQNAGQATSPDSAGGYTIPPAFVQELLVAMQAYGGVRSVARTIRTDRGQDIHQPTLNDTTRKAVIIGENQPTPDGNPLAFGTTTLKAFMYRAPPITVSFEIDQDSGINMEQTVRDCLGESFARAQAEHFTTGSGTGQPQGVVTGAALGKVGVAGQATSVTLDDLIDLQHTPDPAIRNNGRWMFHDDVIRGLRKLKDGNGRFLWDDASASVSGVSGGPTLLGKPVTINQNMPVMSAGARSILYGDFSSYVIRDVMALRLIKLTELYVLNGQFAIVGFMRGDARYVTAQPKVFAYQNSAT